MKRVKHWLGVCVACGAGALVCASAMAQSNTAPSKFTIDADNVLAVNGKKVFPIGFTLPPAPEAKTPTGKLALDEFHDAGALFIRTGPMGGEGFNWDNAWVNTEKAYQAAAAKAGVYCMPWLKEYSAVKTPQQEQKLRGIITMFKDSPGMGIWKGEDEPQWGKKPIPPMVNTYKIIHEMDPNHPVWIVQAPRGTVAELKPYNATYDIGGVDVYPISYPPGTHSLLPNKDISMVGDYTQKMIQVVDNKKTIWMTLQIAWSGVTKQGKTLRFPTFPQERFMTYQAIINGARGLIYFGGNLTADMNDRDKSVGWNWTFWDRVLHPVLEEVGANGPLEAALIAPVSKLPIKAHGEGIEVTAREANGSLYVFACSREPLKTAEIEFTGLPKSITQGNVMFEEPRKVTVKDGTMKDWFAPYDVHVYKFQE